MPELNALHERLAALEGACGGNRGTRAVAWSPGGTGHASMTFSLAAGGFALVQDYRSDTGLTGHGVFSVGDDAVLWHWFDSIGYPPEVPARGAFDGDALVRRAHHAARDEPHDVHARRAQRLTQDIAVDGHDARPRRVPARLALSRL